MPAAYRVAIERTAVQSTYLKASKSGSVDHFGYSLAVDGDTLVVGAFHEDSNATGVNGSVALTDDSLFVGAPGEAHSGRGLNADPKQGSPLYSGAAYLFARNGTDWTQNGYFKGENADQGDGFGYNVAISKTSLAVAAIYEASNASGIDGDASDNSSTNAGAVYVFQ